jgi:glycosyltransferase domain-containing protein
MKDLLTIIIPSHERPDYLKRTLLYLDECFSRSLLNVVVSDSSEAYKRQIEEVCRDFSAEYYHEPGVSYSIKTYNVLKAVKTKFSCILGDDDLLLKEGLESSLHFLRQNPDYAVASGEYIRMHFGEADRVILKPYYTDLGSNDNDSPLVRYYNVMQKFQLTVPGVHRTKVIRRAYQSAYEFSLKVQPHHYTYVDLLLVGIELLYGKYKKLPHYYYVRQRGQSIPYYFDQIPRIKNLLLPHNSEEYQYYKQQVIEALSEVLSGTDHEIPELLDNFVDLSFAFYISTNFTSPKQLNGYLAFLKTSFNCQDFIFTDNDLHKERLSFWEQFRERRRKKEQQRELSAIYQLPFVDFVNRYGKPELRPISEVTRYC